MPFRETVVPRPKVDMMNELIGGQEKNMLAKWSQKDKGEGARLIYGGHLTPP